MRLGTLFLIAILIAVGYFVTAPWWTFRSMRDAARNNDQPALARVVDYDSVRQGLADQLAGRPARRVRGRGASAGRCARASS